MLGLLPISRIIGTHDLPLHCTVDGIYVVCSKSYSNCRLYNAEDFDFIRFQDINLIEVEGNNIKLNNKYSILTPLNLLCTSYHKIYQ